MRLQEAIVAICTLGPLQFVSNNESVIDVGGPSRFGRKKQRPESKNLAYLYEGATLF